MKYKLIIPLLFFAIVLSISTGYCTTGWNANTTTIAGLPTYTDGTNSYYELHTFMNGTTQYALVLNSTSSVRLLGYAFNGTQWNTDVNANNSLPTTMTATSSGGTCLIDNKPQLFWENSTAIFGWTYNGTQWNPNTTNIVGLETSASRYSYFECYNQSNVVYMIHGHSDGTVDGHRWNGSQWVANTTAVGGITDIGYEATSTVWYNTWLSKWWLLEAGQSTTSGGTKYIRGMSWNNSQWVMDSTVNASLTATNDGFPYPEFFQPNGLLANSTYFVMGDDMLNYGDWHGYWYDPTDTTAPAITWVSPTNTTYTTQSIWTNVTTDDATTNWCGYSLDKTANVTMTGSATAWNKLMTSVSEATHNLTVYCNDSYVNMGASSVKYFTVDITAPTITIVSPTNTTLNSQSVWYNLTTNTASSWCGYSLDGTANVSLSNTSTTAWYKLVTTADGSHNVIYSCNDSFGNMGSASARYFTVDITAPTVANINTNHSNPYINSSILFSANWTDATLGSYIFSTNSTGSWVNDSPVAFVTSWSNVTKTMPSTAKIYDWIIYANDSANNIGSTGLYELPVYNVSLTLSTVFTEMENYTLWNNFTNILNATVSNVLYSFTEHNTYSVETAESGYVISGNGWTTPEQVYDEGWATYGNSNATVGTATMRFNYTTPTNYNSSASTLHYKDYTNESYVIISPSCFGSTVNFGINSTEGGISDLNILYCQNTTDGTWITMRTSPTGASKNRIYEEAMSWRIDESENWSTMTTLGGGIWYANQIMPSVSDDTTYIFTTNWSDGTTYTSSSTQTVAKLSISTNSSAGTPFLSTAFFREDNKTAIADMNSMATFTISNGGSTSITMINSTGDTTYYISTPPSSKIYNYNVKIDYWKGTNASTYTSRSFIHYNYSTDSMAELNLYSMPPEYSLLVQTLDSSTAPISGLTIVAKRGYADTNTFESVDMCNTSDNGECTLHLYFNDVYYQIDVWYQNDLLKQLNPQTLPNIYANGYKTFTVYVTENIDDDIYSNSDVTYAITYNDNTKVITATVSGGSQTWTPYRMNVYQKTGFTQTLVENQSSSTPITTFTYTITNGSTSDYYVTLSGTNLTIANKYITQGSPTDTMGGLSVILLVASLGVIIALCFVNPIFGVIAGIGIVVVFWFMGMLLVTATGIGGLVIAGAFLVWKWFR